MIKVIELIVVLALLVFSFFAGVKYSDSVKQHAEWLFQTKEEEVELPDLSNETALDSQSATDENGVSLEGSVLPQDDAAAASQPSDSIGANEAAAPAAPVAPTAPAKK